MKMSVLVIDDDQSVRSFLVDAFDAERIPVAEAADGKTGIDVARAWKPDVVMLDIQMPGMSGVEVLNELRIVDPHLGIIMISSVDTIDTVRQTLKSGAHDYLLKPLSLLDVLETAQRAAERRKLEKQVEEYQRDLEILVFDRTQELEVALDRIQNTYTETILALGAALETRDVETRDHSLRVAGYTRAIAKKLGIADAAKLRDIQRGAFLHDIGKIGVPDHILRKPSSLTEDEWVIMRQHPLIGVRLLSGIGFLQNAIPIVRSHHERWDGKGYPDGLAGTAIPTEARAFAVADALDAITSNRPYRKGRSVAEARRLISAAAGNQFCPESVDALETLDDREIAAIRAQKDYEFG